MYPVRGKLRTGGNSISRFHHLTISFSIKQEVRFLKLIVRGGWSVLRGFKMSGKSLNFKSYFVEKEIVKDS